MSNFLAGTATVTIDGVSVMVAGSFRYSVSKRNRSSLTGMSGIHGYKEVNVTPYIEMEVRDSGGLSMEDFNNQTNVTVAVQLANGKSLVGENMWVVNPQEIDSSEGTFTARFEGPNVTEY